MIVIDSSALVAILEQEPEHQPFKAIISAASRRVLSSVTAYETGVVLLRKRGPEGLTDVRDLIAAFDCEVLAFDQAQGNAALEAYARFGKGIDPKARLNMGDCVAYALAKPKLTLHQKREAITRREAGDETLTDIGRSYNVAASTIARLQA